MFAIFYDLTRYLHDDVTAAAADVYTLLWILQILKRDGRGTSYSKLYALEPQTRGQSEDYLTSPGPIC